MDDLKSLAYSLIPMAVGLAFGGGAGAAHGLTGGVADAGQNRLATDRLNADIQNRNAQIAMEQQRNNMAQERTDLDRQQMVQQAKRFEIEDRRAEKAMQYQDKQMERFDLEMNQARSSQAGQQAFRARLAPEQRDAFDVNPDKYLHEHYQREEEKTRLQGAGAMLAQFGLKDGENMARILGPNGTSHLLGSIIASRQRAGEGGAKNHFGFHFDPNTGTAFSYNQQTGEVISKPIEGTKRPDKPMTPERRTQIEAGIRKEYDETVPEHERQLIPYPKWRASPYGQISEKTHSGQISYEESQGYRQSVARAEAQDEGDAREWMKREYLARNPRRQTAAGFEEYVKGPEGQANLRQYKNALQERGWGRGIGNQPAPTPAPAPRPAAAPTTPSAPRRIRVDAQGNIIP
jgi:hypothetical protein